MGTKSLLNKSSSYQTVDSLFQPSSWKVVLEKPVEYWTRPVARVYRWRGGCSVWCTVHSGEKHSAQCTVGRPATSRGRQSSLRTHTVLSTSSFSPSFQKWPVIQAVLFSKVFSFFFNVALLTFSCSLWQSSRDLREKPKTDGKSHKFVYNRNSLIAKSNEGNATGHGSS